MKSYIDEETFIRERKDHILNGNVTEDDKEAIRDIIEEKYNLEYIRIELMFTRLYKYSIIYRYGEQIESEKWILHYSNSIRKINDNEIFVDMINNMDIIHNAIQSALIELGRPDLHIERVMRDITFIDVVKYPRTFIDTFKGDDCNG